MTTRQLTLGIVAFHPIQYQVPLFRRIAERAIVHVDVLFLVNKSRTANFDPGFERDVTWDIDLLGGYSNTFLDGGTADASLLRRLALLNAWIRSHDAVVIHGYSNPWMLMATVLAQLNRRPYLLRGDSKPRAKSGNPFKRWVRNRVASFVVSRSGAALPIGRLNAEFYTEFGQARQYWAPFSVDDRRFAAPQQLSRCEILGDLRLPQGRPLVIFVGKMIALKRPVELALVASRLETEANFLFIGDGPLRSQVEAAMNRRNTRILGFVNQATLPAYYQAADILVLPSRFEQWGLVVNEAMAAGCYPVVSDQVGAAGDLVDGFGIVFPVDDAEALEQGLREAMARIGEGGLRAEIQSRAEPFNLDATAAGFERACVRVAESRH